MARPELPIEVSVEAGEKLAFAAAIDWPGWCRSGRNETAALQALCDYGARYASVLQDTRLQFQPPTEPSAFVVAERLTGNATTDFGAPNLALSSDTNPIDDREVENWQDVLRACWRAFDAAVQAAAGKTLRTGPRGGGCDLRKIVEHVRDVDMGYLRSLGGKLTLHEDDEPEQALAHIRQSILTTLVAAVNGETPTKGPRGGVHWTPRYFVRRLAWHELDHVWEIEDRAR